MERLTAVLDACVLYPAPLRDLFMHLALVDSFRAKWTDAIHDEWTRDVLETRRDLRPEQLQRTRRLMDAHVRDCLVNGYEDLIPDLALPDPANRHVLAAAIRGGANRIVTFNLKDFPAAALSPHGVEACHPDAFVADLLEREAALVCAAVKRQRESLKNPPKTVEEFLPALELCHLTQTVAALRGLASSL